MSGRRVQFEMAQKKSTVTLYNIYQHFAHVFVFCFQILCCIYFQLHVIFLLRQSSIYIKRNTLLQDLYDMCTY